MLPRKFRASRINIENTIKNGVTIPGNFVYAKISRGISEKPGFAVIVAKKTEKTSVGRHLIKRRIHSILEVFIKKIKPDFKKTLVIFVKKTEKPITLPQIKTGLEEILKKIG